MGEIVSYMIEAAVLSMGLMLWSILVAVQARQCAAQWHDRTKFGGEFAVFAFLAFWYCTLIGFMVGRLW